jgi:hypothetical protein
MSHHDVNVLLLGDESEYLLADPVGEADADFAGQHLRVVFQLSRLEQFPGTLQNPLGRPGLRVGEVDDVERPVEPLGGVDRELQSRPSVGTRTSCGEMHGTRW